MTDGTYSPAGDAPKAGAGSQHRPTREPDEGVAHGPNTGPPTAGQGTPPFVAERTAPAAQSEAQLWVGRTHWKYFAVRLTLWALANLVVAVGVAQVASNAEWLTSTAAAWTIVGLVVVSGAVVVGGVLLRILGSHYRLTSERLFIRRGILSQTTDQLELIRVDDVRVHKTLLGRLLDVGTVIILTTDATDREVQIEGIRGSEKVAEDVRARMRALRGKSLFVETL